MPEKRSFGIYIHIPYCIQRCLYCDFATYEQSQIFPSQEYMQLLREEMRQKSKYFSPQDVDTLYFGGGTPSLVDPQLLKSALEELQSLGFKIQPSTEVTIEINPATITPEKMSQYRDMGINRYSVGAQTFDDGLLKKLGREHNAQQTLETLELLRRHTDNFNFDILFALPNQSLEGLRSDLEKALQQKANHISPYCLTIPKGHVLNPGRAPDEEQIEMFEVIRQTLLEQGYARYEISNFAKPGYESKHNLLYWTDQEYWGLGLSAHSYSKASAWGTRFWNVNSISDYRRQIQDNQGVVFKNIPESLPEAQFEVLSAPQSLTDFCHTSLRLAAGLSQSKLAAKFGPLVFPLLRPRLEKLHQRQLISFADDTWRLTEKGVLISNLVFEELTFLKQDWP